MNNTTCTYDGAWSAVGLPKAYMSSSLDFDGSNDDVTCGTDAFTDFIEATTDFSVIWWHVDYTFGNDYERYFIRESNGGGDGWMVVREPVGSGRATFVIERSGDQDYLGFFSSDAPFADGTHYALAYDWSDDTLTTYENGVVKQNAQTVLSAGAYGWPATTDTTCIGARCTNASGYCESQMNEIGMFSDMLSAAEVNNIMDNGLYEAPVGGNSWFFTSGG